MSTQQPQLGERWEHGDEVVEVVDIVADPLLGTPRVVVRGGINRNPLRHVGAPWNLSLDEFLRDYVPSSRDPDS